MKNGDQILRGYAIINSLQKNVPEGYEVPEIWVREFHSAIDKIEKSLGIDLSDFRVQGSDLKRSVASSNYLTKQVSYREGLWCRREVLIHKIDSVLVYFTGLQSGKKKNIGFRPPGEG